MNEKEIRKFVRENFNDIDKINEKLVDEFGVNENLLNLDGLTRPQIRDIFMLCDDFRGEIDRLERVVEGGNTYSKLAKFYKEKGDFVKYIIKTNYYKLIDKFDDDLSLNELYDISKKIDLEFFRNDDNWEKIEDEGGIEEYTRKYSYKIKEQQMLINSGRLSEKLFNDHDEYIDYNDLEAEDEVDYSGHSEDDGSFS